MTMKNDAKIGEELTCCFKMDTRNLTNLQSLKNVNFDGLFLTEIYNV